MPLKLTAKQAQGLAMLQDPQKDIILFTGGARSGKTFLIMEYMISRAFQFPGSRQLIVRKNLVDTRGSIWDDSLPKYLSLYIPDSEYELMKSELKVQFRNGSTLILGGLDNEERAQKCLGTEYITIFCNEATQMQFPVIGTLQTRLAQKVKDISGKFNATNKMILDCNPWTEKHWLYMWGVKQLDPTTKPPKSVKNPERHAMLHWTAYDNLENLPEGYIETLDALPELQRQRMLLGQWCGGEGQIFKDFNIAIHTCEPFKLPMSWSRFRAIDFGYQHPFAFVCAAYDWATDTIYIYHEFKKSGITIDEAAKEINDHQKQTNDIFDRTWSDHAAADRAFLQQNGIHTTLAKKSVADGINSIAQRLKINPKTGKPRLIIFNNCDNVISEFYSYTWHESKSEVTDKESPIKLDDDAMDCVRYISYGIDKSVNGIF